MLCDHEPELGALLNIDIIKKTVSALLYFPIEGPEQEDSEGKKSKPIIGYEYMNTKGERQDVRLSNDPFVYNLAKLLEHPAFLGDKESCDSWGVYCDMCEDGFEVPKRKVKVVRDGKEVEEETPYTGKKLKMKRPTITGYTPGVDADGIKTETPIYGPDEEYEVDEDFARDITEEVAWMRAHQDKSMYAARTEFIDKQCKWEVT